MTGTRPATIAAVLTVTLLVLLAILSTLLQMVALSGAGERQGATAMGISLACQGAVMLLAAMFARWLTDFLIAKAEWSHIMAIVSAVILAASVGGAISFLAMTLSIPVAGIR
jgi:hypothetical protein